MDFEIVYYSDNSGRKPVEEFLIDLKRENRLLAKQAFKGLGKIRSRTYHRAPLSKYLEPGLWELRIKAGTDILRIVYTFQRGQIIILLHVFVKKQQKTPENELEIARKRLKEIKSRRES